MSNILPTNQKASGNQKYRPLFLSGRTSELLKTVVSTSATLTIEDNTRVAQTRRKPDRKEGRPYAYCYPQLLGAPYARSASSYVPQPGARLGISQKTWEVTQTGDYVIDHQFDVV
jgi:hypothetical protein